MVERPNILVVLTGGQRGDALSAAGVWPIDTPHFDALASAGLALTAITPSPARVPALLSMYTGLHPRQHGVFDDHAMVPNVTGWLACLREVGYRTAGVGRVGCVADQLDEKRIVAEPFVTDPDACEYLRFAVSGGFYAHVAEQRKIARRAALFESTQGLDEPADDVDGFITDAATTMIEHLPRDRSWCMVVAYTGPGNRLPAPPVYLDCLDPAPLAETFVPAHVGELDDYGEFSLPRTMLQRLDRNDAAVIRRHYFARNALIDCGVGMLRDAVDRHGHARNTWTVLSSDRGELLGERGAFAGTSFVGSAAYVPLWVTPPQPTSEVERANEETFRAADGLISATSLASTICEIAKADVPLGCMGRSVLTALGGGRLGGDMAISEFGDRLMVETLQYKAVFDVPTGRLRVLFDMVADPDERTNLVGSPVASNVIDMVQRRLAAYLMRLRPVVVR